MTGFAPQPGDRPEPSAGFPFCGAQTRPLGGSGRTFVCSRAPHPDGPHAADDGTTVLAVWTDGNMPDVLGVPRWML